MLINALICQRRPVIGRLTGFTLIEMIVALLVVAILALVAVPAMVSLVQGNAMRGAEEVLLSALAITRSEAITRNEPIAICASGDGANCAGASASNWQQGWIVFTDRTGTAGVVDGSDQILRVHEGVSLGMTVRFVNSGGSDIGVIRFKQRTGVLVTSTNSGEFRVCHSDADTSDARRVLLGATGRAALDDQAPVACP